MGATKALNVTKESLKDAMGELGMKEGFDVSQILTHHFPANDFQQGFDVMRSGQSGKVVLDWS